MVSVIGGLWVMSGSAPLAAQATPSATRSFSPAVVPGGELTVTITATGYGSLGGIIETLPADFTVVSIAVDSDGVQIGQQIDDAADGRERVRFTLLAAPQTVSYVARASSTEGMHTFTDGVLIDDDAVSHDIEESTVTVAADAVTPDPDPEAAPDLAIPDLDSLNPATQDIFVAGMAGNSVQYTAASGTDDAKVVARVSPGAEAIITIDLGMAAFPDSQQVNFSLTDGANLDFQIKKTGDDTAEIVVKDGVTLTAGRTISNSLLMSSATLPRIPRTLTLLCMS